MYKKLKPLNQLFVHKNIVKGGLGFAYTKMMIADAKTVLS